MAESRKTGLCNILNPDMNRRRFLLISGTLAAGASVRNLVKPAPVSALVTGQNPPDATEVDAGVQVIMSACQNCHSRCGIMARVKDGVLLKIDGNPYHPNNFDPDERPPYSTSVDVAKKRPGRLCAKGQAGVQVVYDPYRIKQPLKRVGPRGSGQWKAITWEQAFQEIAAKLKPLRDLNTLIDPAAPELGPVANQVLYSAGRTIEGGFTDRVWGNGFGTINKREDHTSICETSHHVANELMTWDEKANRGRKNHFKPDIVEAKYIMLFGSSFLEANFPMVATARKLMDFRAKGGKYVVVDPRFSNTAALAHRWVPVKPGGDAALALGMARWMLENKKYDAKYLANANQAAAKASGEPTWTDATRLVVVDPSHADARRYLRADAIGGKKENYVAWSGGGPKEIADAALVGDMEPGEVTVAGRRCKTVFQLLKERVFSRSLAQYAADCGLSVDLIVTLAGEFAAAGKQAVTNAYRGAVQHTNGVYNQLSINILNTLTGNYDWRGGNGGGGGGYPEGSGVTPLGTVPGGVSAKGIKLNRTVKQYEKDGPNLFKRDGGYPAKRPWFPYATHGNYQEVIPSAADGYPYPIKALITYWNAWPYSTPGLRKTFEDYVKDEKKLELFVAISLNMGEVAAFADYVLPDTTYLEKWAFPGMTPTILTKATPLQQPVVGKLDGKDIGTAPFNPDAPNVYTPVLPNTKTVGDIHIGLAKTLGLPGVGEKAFQDGSPLNTYWDFYKKGLQNLSKNTGKPIGEIVAKGGVFEDPGNEYDGKYLKYKYGNVIKIYIEQLATTKDSMTGQYFDGLPQYDPPKFADNTAIATVDEKDFPFQLITYKMVWHAQARTASIPWLMIIQPENFVEINASDARRLGIRDGDAVRLVSATSPGGVVGKARATEGVRPGVIAVSHHFGHWELAAKPHVVDGVAQGADPSRGTGIQVNPIMRLDQFKGKVLNTSIQDKVGGSVSFYDSRVKLVKA
ncbi:MAG: molybdopterin-dependent oxidoreductase [candidate division NC10 bacterium]|nr:molybdopterin-dependent oxidoreductase [candidate division NC10 bacterium]MBI2457991.1 molybdopterin-dependent oxidoreductase [candidate division NC10 bacterium]